MKMNKWLWLMIPFTLLFAGSSYAITHYEDIEIKPEYVSFGLGTLDVSMKVNNPTALPVYASSLYMNATYKNTQLASTLYNKPIYIAPFATTMVKLSVYLNWDSLSDALKELQKDIEQTQKPEVLLSGHLNLNKFAIPFEYKIAINV